MQQWLYIQMFIGIGKDINDYFAWHNTSILLFKAESDSASLFFTETREKSVH